MQTQIKKLVLKKFYLRLRSQGNIRFLKNYFMSYRSIYLTLSIFFYVELTLTFLEFRLLPLEENLFQSANGVPTTDMLRQEKNLTGFHKLQHRNQQESQRHRMLRNQ